MISPKILCRILQAVALRAGVLMVGISSQGSAADIHVAWNHYVGADPVIYDSLRYRNKAGQEWSVKQLSYLISGLSLQREYFWDGRSPSLRDQALIPVQDHREMDESLDNIVAKLTQLNTYPAAFERAFGSREITAEKMGLAVENFLLTLTSHDSKFDRSMRGDGKLSDEEERGFELFMTEREPRMGSMSGDCFHCHGGALFTDHQFRNNGLEFWTQI